MKPATSALAILLLGLLAFIAFPPARAAETYFEARVVKVFDGDTVEVIRSTASALSPTRVDGGDGTQRLRIRLFGIDAPERGQPWANRSRQALSARVLGRSVRINEVDTDRYGRTVGEIYAANECVNCALVRDGHAWVYRRYTDDPALIALEDDARLARRGLWGLPDGDRVPPWKWRERQRSQRRGASESRPREPAPTSTFSCGTRSRCAEMQSCAEARYHLDVCLLDGIDGDGDGTPCERICTRD